MCAARRKQTRANARDIREKKRRSGLEKLIKFYNVTHHVASVWCNGDDQRPDDVVVAAMK